MRNFCYQLIAAVLFCDVSTVQRACAALPISLPPAHAVHGQVQELNGGVVPGVSVSKKGTQRGTVTNERGEFNIDVQSQDSVLVFSFLEYKTIEVAIGNRSEISVELAVKDRSLNEVVVVGYGNLYGKLKIL